MIQTPNGFLGAALAAASVTAALFCIMAALVRVEAANIPRVDISRVVSFVHVEPQEQPVETIRRRPIPKTVVEPEPLPPFAPGNTSEGIQRIVIPFQKDSHRD